jgi:hypothetical protein
VHESPIPARIVASEPRDILRVPFGFSYRQLQPFRVGRAIDLRLTLRQPIAANSATKAETLINEEK